MGHGLIADVIQMFEFVGLSWTLTILMALLLLYVGIKKFQSRARELQSTYDTHSETMRKIDESLSLDSGQTVRLAEHQHILEGLNVRFVENCEGCETHRNELLKLSGDVKEIRADLEVFINEGKESRKVTQDILTTTSSKLDVLSDKIISVLSSALELQRK